MSRLFWLRLWVWAAGFCLLASIVSAGPFEFKPMSPQRADRLGKEARHEYDLGLAAIDKVNNDLALEHFVKAVQLEPDNPWLRFSTVQVAIRLGDTRNGSDSIRFYDLAAQNLKAIGENPRLNIREQQRAQAWFQTVTELRQSVLERDAKRIQHGREIAKQYAKEIYRPTEAEKEKALAEKKKARAIPGKEKGKEDTKEGAIDVSGGASGAATDNSVAASPGPAGAGPASPAAPPQQ